MITIDLANGHGNTGALVLFNYANLVFTAICSVLPIAIVTSAFPVLSATDGDEFDRTSAGSTRAVMLMSWLGTAVMIAVTLPAAHVLTQQPDQVAPLALAFLLYAPGVAGLRHRHQPVAGAVRPRQAQGGGHRPGGAAAAARGALRPAGPAGAAAPGRGGARARQQHRVQLVVAVPTVIATRRLRGPAAVAGLGHATARRDRGGRRRRPRRASRSRWSCPPAGTVLEVGSGLIAAMLAVVVFGVVAYALDRGDLRAVAGRLRRFARSRAVTRAGRRWIMVDVYPRDVAIRPVEENDRPTVEWLTTQLWGAPEVAVHDGVFYPAALPGFIAERAGRIAGLVTFEVRDRHPGDRHDQRP